MEPTDRELIERLRSGDAAAIEPLMARFAGRVYRLAHGITRSTSDAEEVVQDVFVTILRKIGTFEERAALSTWIYRITTNVALNRRRGKRAELEVPIEDHLPTFKDDGHRDGERSFLLADWSQTPDEELLSKEGREMVRSAIDRLPAHYRAVLLLVDLEGLSSGEAAGILDESVGAVKTRLHRARMALREQITRVYAPGVTPAARPFRTPPGQSLSPQGAA